MPTDAGTIVSHLLALKAVPPFSALPPDDLSLLVARARPRELLANEVLVADGAQLASVYLVLSGRLEEYRNDRLWSEHAPFELVAGVDALAGVGERLVVRAATAAEVLELARDDLLDVCLDRFAVLETVAAGVAAVAIAARRRLGPAAGFAPPASEAPPVAPPSPDPSALLVHLHDVAPLAGISIHTLAYCAAESTPIALERDHPLWHAGDPSDHVVLVLGGTVVCASDDGTQRFTMGAGEMVGALDVMANVPRWHDARAASPVHGLRIERSALLDVLEDDPETAVQALVGLSRVAAVLVDRVAGEQP